MTSVTPTGRAKVESLVKDALKEALEKKAAAAGMPSSLLKSMIEGVVEPEAKKEEEPKETIPLFTPPPLKDGQKFLSDVLGVKKVAIDFPVTCFHTYEWDERVAHLIPDVEPDYYLDPELSSSILQAWEIKDKVLTYGPTGSGKSSLIEQLCARTHRPFLRINCSGDMDSSMIFGQLLAKDGSTFWMDGSVTEAVKYGAVFAWDEWDVTPADISMGLQWLLEENGKLFLKDMPGKISDKMIKPHEHFRLCAIGNTRGQGDETGAHAGTNVQNTATLDRFGTCLFIDYLAPNIERDMLSKKCPHLSKSQVAGFIQFANLIRTGYKAGQLALTISQRTLFNVAKKIMVGMKVDQAFQLVYFNKLNPTQEKVAKELWVKVFGKV